MTMQTPISSTAMAADGIASTLHFNGGELTGAQLAGFRKVFQYFDKDDNGSVDAEEIFTQAVSLGLAVTKAQVTGAMAARKEKTLGGQEEKELTFDQFLSILTCTDRYLETLRNESGGKEGVVFSAVSKYLRTQRGQNDGDDELMSELEHYYSRKARTLQPHVIADYAAGNRLIGLSERQLKQGLVRFRMANQGTQKHASPYASTTLANIRGQVPPLKLRRRRSYATEAEVLVVRPPSELIGVSDVGQHTALCKYRIPKVRLPAISREEVAGCIDSRSLRCVVKVAVSTHKKLAAHDHVMVAKQHWDILQPAAIPSSRLRARFGMTFAAYNAGPGFKLQEQKDK